MQFRDFNKFLYANANNDKEVLLVENGSLKI